MLRAETTKENAKNTKETAMPGLAEALSTGAHIASSNSSTTDGSIFNESSQLPTTCVRKMVTKWPLPSIRCVVAQTMVF